MKKYKKSIIFGFCIFSALWMMYLNKLDALAWFFWHNAQLTHEQHALHLKDYRVKIDALAIKGLKNASGLTHNAETNTLFTVLNQESKLVELSLKGEVIRTVHVRGVDDMEGITHIDGNQYVIADERDNRLILIHLPDNTNELDVTDAPKIRLGMNDRGNKNFEGVSWDDHQKLLLVVKERDPKYLIYVKGLADYPKNGVQNLDVERLTKYDNMLSWAMRDLSSVNYISQSKHMLLLSEESKLVKEFDENAKPIGALALWGGFHGLKNNIPQAEGITIDEANNIYVISEPNLFYVFGPN